MQKKKKNKKCWVFNSSIITQLLRLKEKMMKQKSKADIWKYKQGHMRKTKLQTTELELQKYWELSTQTRQCLRSPTDRSVERHTSFFFFFFGGGSSPPLKGVAGRHHGSSDRAQCGPALVVVQSDNGSAWLQCNIAWFQHGSTDNRTSKSAPRVVSTWPKVPVKDWVDDIYAFWLRFIEVNYVNPLMDNYLPKRSYLNKSLVSVKVKTKQQMSWLSQHSKLDGV